MADRDHYRTLAQDRERADDLISAAFFFQLAEEWERAADMYVEHYRLHPESSGREVSLKRAGHFYCKVGLVEKMKRAYLGAYSEGGLNEECFLNLKHAGQLSSFLE